jgi:two-component system chemotaxis sensor kinase CheA
MLLGECYSVVRLSKVFDIETEVQAPEDGMLMHLTSEERDFCILFDQLDGEYQVVAKSLPAYLSKCTSRLEGISGCAVLGDGSINLILDVNHL